MDDRKKLALLIVNHMKNQLQSGIFDEDAKESLEVAVQCIESAYNLSQLESANVDITLEQIVKEYFENVGQKV